LPFDNYIQSSTALKMFALCLKVNNALHIEKFLKGGTGSPCINLSLV